MATNTTVSMDVAKDMVDAASAGLEVGSAGNPLVRIYSGAQPASPDAAVGGATLLAEIDMGAAAVFAAAATGTGAESNSAVGDAAAVLPKSDTDANATGTAAWFRAIDRDGTKAVTDGTVGTADADMLIDSVAISAGQTVRANSWKMRVARS